MLSIISLQCVILWYSIIASHQTHPGNKAQLSSVTSQRHVTPPHLVTLSPELSKSDNSEMVRVSRAVPIARSLAVFWFAQSLLWESQYNCWSVSQWLPFLYTYPLSHRCTLSRVSSPAMSYHPDIRYNVTVCSQLNRLFPDMMTVNYLWVRLWVVRLSVVVNWALFWQSVQLLLTLYFVYKTFNHCSHASECQIFNILLLINMFTTRMLAVQSQVDRNGCSFLLPIVIRKVNLVMEVCCSTVCEYSISISSLQQDHFFLHQCFTSRITFHELLYQTALR